MSEWILVVMMAYLGNALVMQEFSSQERCEAAKRELLNDIKGSNVGQATKVWCFKK